MFLKRPLVSLDVETTTINEGDPYCPNNRLVSLVVYNPQIGFLEYYKQFPKEIQKIIDTYTLILANGKFDLAWLRREGFDLTKANIVDVQYAQYLISNQQDKFASVDNMASAYLNKHKIDKIKLEYWDKGIDTWYIPKEDLMEYNREDCKLEFELFEKQLTILQEQNKLPLFLVHCDDLLVLEEMQWNGIKYDVTNSLQKASELEAQLNILEHKFKLLSEAEFFNPGSGDHLSALLYGGTLTNTIKVPIGVFKTGTKVGHIRYKNIKEERIFPRLIDPLPNTEYVKGNVWSTEEDTLKSLPKNKTVKPIIELILEFRGIKKLISTYLVGFPNIIKKRGWENEILHSNLNQCITITGRLSSTKPNQQNMDGTTKQFCISRY